jgi:hypothetical protein
MSSHGRILVVALIKIGVEASGHSSRTIAVVAADRDTWNWKSKPREQINTMTSQFTLQPSKSKPTPEPDKSMLHTKNQEEIMI